MAFLRQHLAKLAPAVLVGGCSLIYNPSSIGRPSPDAMPDGTPDIDMMPMIDAAIDAPPLFDADPIMLIAEKVSPAVIYEGQGIDGSRKALLVIRGHHMTTATTVAITPLTDLTPDMPTVSANGDFMLVPITVAINGSRDDTETLNVQVSKPGAPDPAPLTLTLDYLPELDSGTTIPVSSLVELYSRVDLGNVTFTGGHAIVRAVSSITIGDVDISGEDAVGSTIGAAGPGGCPGGAAGTTGGCSGSDGGGLGASGANGGGGAGFGTMGAAGAGGAAGGAAHGNPQIVNYVAGQTNTNRSSGGGGGQGVGLGIGGAGGGGGGSLELTAGGDIMTGVINADGGNGGNGTGGITSLTDASGGGGGGSGGVIVIRSAAGMITNGTITARGGMAGMPRLGGGGGGAGGEGRIRIDAPVTVPTTNPVAHRGPTFSNTTPIFVTQVKPTLTMFGHDGDKLDGYVIDMDNVLRLGEPLDQTIASNTVSIMPTLIPGHNKLCFTLEPGARPTMGTMNPVPNPLSDSCIDIVYLP